MNQEDKKKSAALAAMQFIQPGMTLGVGTGSTVKYFIEALAQMRDPIEAAVASSNATEALLKQYKIPLTDLNSAGRLPIYVDGADEATQSLHLIKGGGGALTREKIIAAASDRFICIADETKLVKQLGAFPLPVEVIPMARSFVGREMIKLGGEPVLRTGYTTDNGNLIIDVHYLEITDPLQLEIDIKSLPGVVDNGIFARRPADVLILSSTTGINQYS